MNKAFRVQSFNLAMCGSICAFSNTENCFFPYQKKKRLRERGKKKKEGKKGNLN